MTWPIFSSHFLCLANIINVSGIFYSWFFISNTTKQNKIMKLIYYISDLEIHGLTAKKAYGD